MTKDYQNLSKFLGIALPVRNTLVGDIYLDSRQIGAGDIFVAMHGRGGKHGIEFAAMAMKNGAALVLTDTTLEVQGVDNSRLIVVEDLAERLGALAKWRYGERGYPRVVAITGTNGKTSVAWFIAQLLNYNGISCGYIGTLGTGSIEGLVPSEMTTPDVFSMHRLLAKAQSDGFEWMSVEASSHALDQGRLDGIHVTGALFTTFSRDHLDYHHTMEAYLASKVRLLHRPELDWLVINKALEPLGISEVATKTISYGSQSSDVLYRVVPMQNGLDIEATMSGESVRITPSLFGRYQGENLVAALIATALITEQSFEGITGANSVGAPTGRMEVFHLNEVVFVVDYAHTPDALKTALSNLKEHEFVGQLWALIGCGGDRDKGKRPQMGAIAESLANVVLITNDNPRSEDGEVIAADIASGMKNAGEVRVILDRAEAIQYAIECAKSGDVVLIAGKGHEDYQEINNVRYPFSDQAHLIKAGAKAGVAYG